MDTTCCVQGRHRAGLGHDRQWRFPRSFHRKPATLSREILQCLLRQPIKFQGSSSPTRHHVHRARRRTRAMRRPALDAGCDEAVPKILRPRARNSRKAWRPERWTRTHQLSLRRRPKWASGLAPRSVARAAVRCGFPARDRAFRSCAQSPRVTSPIGCWASMMTSAAPIPNLAAIHFHALSSRASRESASRAGPHGRARGRGAVRRLRGWKGRPGYSAEARKAVDKIIDKVPEAVVVQFSHPRLAGELKKPKHIVSAWGGESVMQRAAARWLLKVR